MLQKTDVLVVGGGPAGLMAALELVRRTQLRVTVIDAGADIDDRVLGRSHAEYDHRVWGVGGAGLFSDGKLCLSLGVGGELGALLDGDSRISLLRRVAHRLRALHVLDEAASPTWRSHEADRFGFELTYYPVLHIGSDRCAERIRLIRNALVRAGGQVCARTELLQLERRGMGFRAVLHRNGHEQAVSTRRVVLAMGKAGAGRQGEICQALGATVRPLPMYVGARLETDRATAAPLFGGVVDPKYKLHFTDGSKLKMHCAADGGAVLPLRYDDFVLAGGHADRHAKSTRSSFGLLWNGLHVGRDPLGRARDLMERAAQAAPGSLLAHRLVDCLQGRPSSAADVARTQPSTRAWVAGDLRAVLPREYFERLDVFVGRLNRLTPGVVGPTTVLFGPAIEWWMSRVETDTTLETAVGGLFVAGDGSGWSQGIVHAAATGVVVADGIVRQSGWERTSANHSGVA